MAGDQLASEFQVPLLQSCFAGGANNYPAANEWAKTAAPFLLKINSADNGKQLNVP